MKDLQGPINEPLSELSAQLGRAPRPSEIAVRLEHPAADVLEALNAAQAYRLDILDMSRREESDLGTLTDTRGAPDPGLSG